MTTPEEYRPLAAGAPQPASQPPQPEAPPPRFTDWISYALAVTQPANSMNDVETQHFASRR